MKDSELRTRAKALALHIIAVCDDVDTRKGRSVLVNQIVRSATSIGANIHEANYAASKADFINKFHIALKECGETEYWIEMLVGSNAISEQTAKDLLQECGVIRMGICIQYLLYHLNRMLILQGHVLLILSFLS